MQHAGRFFLAFLASTALSCTLFPCIGQAQASDDANHSNKGSVHNQSVDSEQMQVGVHGDGSPILVKVPARAKSAAPQRLNLPIADNSLWFRYYQAGEDASIKHDADVAKRYYLASLGELEKNKPAKGADMFLAVKLSALEVGLMDSYPADWSTQKESTDEVMKMRKDQVDTYLRIARINEYFAPPDDLLRIKATERYQNLRQKYEKDLAAVNQNKK